MAAAVAESRSSGGAAGRGLALLGLSLLLHGGVGLLMNRLSVPSALRPNESIEVAVIDAPPPKPPAPEPPKPPPPKPAPVKLARAPRKAPQELPKLQQPPPPPQNAPPPPTVEAKNVAPPVVLPGITLESTSSAGGFAVNTGNTLYGDPGRKGHDASAVKPYKATRYVSQAQISEPPSVAFKPDIEKCYPADARRKEFEGDVVLRLIIDSDGTVAKAEVLTDPGEGLGAAAGLCIKQFRFNPGKLNGEAVATPITFTVHFQMRD